MIERLTLATATGLPFLSLAFHAGTGLIALVAGFVGLATRKGGPWHRASGLVFVFAMTLTGLTAVGIALYEGRANYGAGALTAYFVLTAFTAVRPSTRFGRPLDVALMVLAAGMAAAGFAAGFVAFGRPGHQMNGVPAGMMFFMSTVVMLAAIGDARMIRAGGIHGARRLARHLWRMCYGLFIASGSFFLGQMKFIPEPIRSLPLLFVLGVSPLAILVYWMWRVRFRRNLRGLITGPTVSLPVVVTATASGGTLRRRP